MDNVEGGRARTLINRYIIDGSGCGQARCAGTEFITVVTVPGSILTGGGTHSLI